MKMTALLKQGLSPEIISLWRACQGESLLPLQASAVRDGLFAPGNLLIQAPTSSGNTAPTSSLPTSSVCRCCASSHR